MNDKQKLIVIAGRNKIGAMNWGASVVRHPLTLKAELKRLQFYFGRRIYLVGGGGYGLRSGILDNAKILEYKGMGKALKVWLSHLEPPMTYHDNGEFDPWIDSWQIAVPK